MPRKVLSKKVLKILRQEEPQTLSIFDLMEHFGVRAFGPLLLLPAIMMVSPTGAIPGVPLIMGPAIILISAQMMFSRRKPWLPSRLGEMSFARDKVEDGLRRSLPYIKKVERYLRPRLKFLVPAPFLYLTALLCVAMGVSMLGLGFVPFANLLPGLAVLCLALGLSAHDGLFILLGYLFSFATAGLIIYLILEQMS